MLFDIFKKKGNTKQTPLKNYIPNCKRYSGEQLFVTIMNDLNTDAFKDDEFAFMTYGYARRSVAAFLYLQGHINKEEMEHQILIFTSLQMRTNTSRDFQESATIASIEFLQEYSSFFTRENISIVVSSVVGGGVVDNKSQGMLHSDEKIKQVTAIMLNA